MRAFEIHEFGIDNLRLVERETPSPGPGEVLVRMTAASLNYRDLMVVEGQYNPKLPRPMVPLSDGAGIVEAIGPGVTRVKPGDRVAGIFMQTWLDGGIDASKARSAMGGAIAGVLSEYRAFHQDGLMLAPEHLDDVETATLPCAAVTAWHAIFETSRARPGDTALIQGTGGVALFALQLSHSAGLRPIVISSSDQKLERAREMGAIHTVNYKREPQWEKAVASLVPGGVDIVIELGGADTLARSVKAVRMGGTVAVIGALGGVGPCIDPRPVLMNSIRLQGIYVGSRKMFERMSRAVEAHRIRPVVDRTFPWLEVKEAMRYMQSQAHFGKVALQF